MDPHSSPWNGADEKGIRTPLKVGGTALLALSFQTLGTYRLPLFMVYEKPELTV
jgi:hypothetical protein